MAPLILPGDKILIQKITPEKVSFGDIFVFKYGGDLIVHRLIRIRQTEKGIFFYEKGDTEFYGRLIPARTVIGKVIAIERRGKILNLDSVPSHITSMALSAWFFTTCIIINKLRSSQYRTIKWIGWEIRQFFSFSSKVLTTACFMVWYPAGALAKRDGYPDRHSQAI